MTENYPRQLKKRYLATNIDSDKLLKDINEKFGTRAEIARKLGISASVITESLKRGYMKTVYLVAVTQLLGKEIGYYEAPVEEEEEKAAETEKTETLNVELLVELKKIEALLISINRKMDGKPTASIIKGERNANY